MSALRDLLHDAYVAGAESVTLTVDLGRFFGDSNASSWEAAVESGGSPRRAAGRTHEDALENLVNRLKGPS